MGVVSELPITKALACALGCLLTAWAVHASDRDIERFNIGGTAFCVPGTVIAEEPPGWLPKDLPRDGFGFYVPQDQISQIIPQRDKLGRVQEFTAYVSSRTPKTADALRRVLAERARAPGAILKRLKSLHLVFAYESKQGDHWVAWKLPKSAALSADALAESGTPIATCSMPSGSIRNPSWKGSAAVCRRTLDADGIRLGYSVDAENLDRYEWLDGRLKDIVLNWRCAV